MVMNERIAKLYDQALVLESNGDYVAGELDPVKFAELIVQKCVSIVALHGITNFENEDISWACKNIVKEVKEHFGVEE
jgi:hypothetical protein